MGGLIFLANPASPHVRRWVELIGDTRSIQIFHIAHEGEILCKGLNITLCQPLPHWARRLPSVLQYALLGMWLRKRLLPKNATVHAHNTSGYGIAARLSGRRYGITTYGTEIFSLPDRSIFYRAAIRSVLRHASFITATTDAMRDAILRIEPATKQTISVFSLGVPSEYLAPPSHRTFSGPKKWIVNRRIHPLYSTVEVVLAFRSFLAEGGDGILSLIEGMSDAPYLQAVLDAASGEARVHIIRGFISNDEMLARLDAAQFCISVPASDQLSSAILEGAARGCIPVLRKLPAYRPIRGIAWIVSDQFDLTTSLKEMFFATSALGGEDVQAMSRAARQLIDDEYSHVAIRRDMEKIPDYCF